MSDFKATVIIPVYNAEKYLRQAVESAVNLDAVGEVILIEDNSPDNALALCEKLDNEYNKVKLFRHANGENRGAGASRNLGIKKAKYEYIAFLDADDIYLNNRFEGEKKIFPRKFDGMYHTSGYIGSDKLMKLKEEVSGYKVFTFLLKQKCGTIPTNCITVRKDLLFKAGLFKETLRLHQDTELWLRLTINNFFVPGITGKPVALIREHRGNRITGANRASKKKLWLVILKKHFLNWNLSFSDRLYIVKVILSFFLRK